MRKAKQTSSGRGNQVDLRIWLTANNLDLDQGTDRLRRQLEIVLTGLSPHPSALAVPV